jgi:Sulfotransferase family
MENATALVENPAARAPGRAAAVGARSTAPVFVLGSGRCGTKFLYYSLLSAGGFAVCPPESNAFNVLGLCFGNLASRGNRRRLLDAYLASKLFQQTGLDPINVEERVMENCRNAGDLLRILMEAIARKQGVHRWAESTPRHSLHLPLIKKLIPDALVVHIIRDGRDVTASLLRAGWVRPLPWDRTRAFLAPAIYWRWIVSKGRRYGQAFGANYMEVHYEDLVQNPRETLARIGQFIEHDLDYDRIQQVALGTVHNPNSSFRGDGKETETNTIGRWKRMFTPAQVRDIESSLGNLLVDTGYALETPAAQLRSSLAVRFMNFLLPLYLDSKLWLKSYTPLARIAEKTSMGLADSEIKVRCQDQG